ncbi:uncharacterized protein LOC142232169 [Haematobia irritans]|uniref:uncharacterized protein LOC142232169 n=1 Tax=Haematobia irritans TaxID=7368 RepID=UPI003F4F7CA6
MAMEHVFKNILLDFINEHEEISYDIISELNKFDQFIKGHIHPSFSHLERCIEQPFVDNGCLENVNNIDSLLLEYADYSWNSQSQPSYICKLCSKEITEREFTSLDQFLSHLKKHHEEEHRQFTLDRQSSKLWITELERIKNFKYKQHSEEFLKEIDQILEADDFDVVEILKSLDIHEKQSQNDVTSNKTNNNDGKETKKKKKRTSGVCEVCNRTFNDLYNLRIHKMIHSGEKPFQCEVCGKRFRQYNKLKIHCITHTNDKPYICEICGKGFRFRNYLSVHKRLHFGENPYKCKFCNEHFHSLHSRRLHTKMMHCEAKTFPCPICDKILTAQCYLIAHLKRHLNQRDYKCEICGKCFFSYSQLKDHKLVHSNLKPHQCNLCNARFQRKSNFIQHLKIHSGEKNYVCDICTKSFAQNAGLYGHMKSHAKYS